MTERNESSLNAEQRLWILQLRRKYPSKSSICGALLSEMRSSRAVIGDRIVAARLHGELSCRRGLRILDQLTLSTYATLLRRDGEDVFPCGPERHLFSALLYAIARIDTMASHSKLVEYFSSIENIHLRSDVLEAVAFERKTFDPGWVLGVLSRVMEEPLLLSGLYAVMLHGGRYTPGALRSHLRHFLAHDSGNVRAYAARALASNGDTKTYVLLSELLDDPNPEVRDSTADAMTWIS